MVRKPLGELGKVSEEGERKEDTAARYRTPMYLIHADQYTHPYFSHAVD